MTSRPVPDWLLERYVLGELPDHERRDVEARLDEEAGGAERVARLRASNREILAAHPAAEMVPAILRKVHLEETREAVRSRGRSRRWAAALLVPAMAAAVALAVVRVDLPFGDTVEDVRPKGMQPRLALYLHTSDGGEPLTEGAVASPSDVVQVAYVAADAPYGVILSVDGRGAVTLHWPESPDADTALTSDGETAVPHAYELDDAPGFERFFLVTADDPIDPTVVVMSAHRLARSGQADGAALELPDGLHQTSFLLRKEAP